MKQFIDLTKEQREIEKLEMYETILTKLDDIEKALMAILNTK